VVSADPFAPDAVALRADLSRGIVGFRLAPACPQSRTWAAFDRSADWLYDALEAEASRTAAREADAVCQRLVHDGQLDQVFAPVERYPDLTYSIDHFARTDPSTLPDGGAFADLVALAAHDVAVKLFGAAPVSTRSLPCPDSHDHVRWLLETSGRERVIRGSDYSSVSDVTDYPRTLAWLDAVDGLSAADREWPTDRAFRGHAGL